MEAPDPTELANRVRIAEQSVPEICERATVAILRTKDAATVPMGTGTLFRIADRSFVVTAAHVVRGTYAWGWGLAITGNDGKIVETGGDWLCSPTDSKQPDKGLGDIAVYGLTSVQVRDLEGKGFARLSDVSMTPDVKHGFYRLLGYPQMLSEPSNRENEKVLLGSFTFATNVYQGNVSGLEDYEQSVHFLLDAADNNLVDSRGRETRLRGRHQVAAKLTSGVKGISGCAVWRIGKVGQPPERWTREDAALTGVAIATYEKSEVIKVTRWRFVQKLIYEGFPDLREPLKLMTKLR